MSENSVQSDWEFDLLKLFAWDDCESLMWTIIDGRVVFHVFCSDTFWWATADCETVVQEDLPDLKKAKEDLPEGDWPILWVARKRKLRPMRLWLNRSAQDERIIFEEAGPTRAPGTEG